MKKLSDLVFSFTNMFFNFLKDRDVEKLQAELDRINEISRNRGDKMLMIKFGNDSTLLYTIKELKRDAELPENHSNKKLLIEQMELVVNSMDANKEVEVYC
jgi:hypothetical protein